MTALALAHTATDSLARMAALFRRELASRLCSLWFFLLASVACMIATLYGGGFQRAFATESVLVSSNPLAVLNTIVAIFLAVVLGLRLSASLSWEREHGTLEVLLMAPVGPRAIVGAKFAAEVIVLALLLLVYGAFLLIAQPMGGGVIRPADVLSLGTIVALMLPVMALGLSLSALFAGVRAAVIAYLIVVGLLAAFEGVQTFLAFSQPQDLGIAMLYLRTGMETADRVVSLVSPVSPLADLVMAAVDGTVIKLSHILAVVVLALVTVALGAEAMRMRSK